MKTPIADFLRAYSSEDRKRFHMPGHKGHGDAMRALDITEVDGADSLYSADGIIKESERIASEIFGAKSFYSTEGSSLAIRAMLYLATLRFDKKSKKPTILAGRNAHKVFISAAAMLDFEVEWISGEGASYLSCPITSAEVALALDSLDTLPVAVYLTSPDYLGNMLDISAIAEVCHERGVLLLVDNAHGSYLKFLKDSRHPIDLGADMCTDSAHKTLPALTGSAYLHISRSLPDVYARCAKDALALFGSTSPSYLILASLDELNATLASTFKDELSALICKLDGLKGELLTHGYTLAGDEPMKITISAKSYGYTGYELAAELAGARIIPEFYDNDFLVLMPTPSNTDEELSALSDALLAIPQRCEIKITAPALHTPERVCSIREAMLSPSEVVDLHLAVGRTLAVATVACPPAVPIAVPGEIIDEDTVRVFEYYKTEKLTVIK